MFRRDRKEKKGGGVMLFIQNSFEVTECTEFSSSGFEEAVWCVIRLSRTEKLLVGVCYRSPNSSEENTAILNKVLKK